MESERFQTCDGRIADPVQLRRASVRDRSYGIRAPSESVDHHIGVEKPTHQRMAYYCRRELPSHAARASRSIVSPSAFSCIVPSNLITLSQSGFSLSGL